MEETTTATDNTGERTTDTQAGAETTGPSFARMRIREDRTCVACEEEKSTQILLALPCGHEYCISCLDIMFEMAIANEASYPPRCCAQALPREIHDVFINPDVRRRFDQKALEFDTPPGERVYCYANYCSSFIPNGNGSATMARCPNCARLVCKHCSTAAHEGACQSDAEPVPNELLSIADKEHWQRCPSCHRLVERDDGCNHITCVCTAEFCYICGSRWGTCGTFTCTFRPRRVGTLAAPVLIEPEIAPADLELPAVEPDRPETGGDAMDEVVAEPGPRVMPNYTDEIIERTYEYIERIDENRRQITEQLRHQNEQFRRQNELMRDYVTHLFDMNARMDEREVPATAHHTRRAALAEEIRLQFATLNEQRPLHAAPTERRAPRGPAPTPAQSPDAASRPDNNV